MLFLACVKFNPRERMTQDLRPAVEALFTDLAAAHPSCTINQGTELVCCP